MAQYARENPTDPYGEVYRPQECDAVRFFEPDCAKSNEAQPYYGTEAVICELRKHVGKHSMVTLDGTVLSW